MVKFKDLIISHMKVSCVVDVLDDNTKLFTDYIYDDNVYEFYFKSDCDHIIAAHAEHHRNAEKMMRYGLYAQCGCGCGKNNETRTEEYPFYINNMHGLLRVDLTGLKGNKKFPYEGYNWNNAQLSVNIDDQGINIPAYAAGISYAVKDSSEIMKELDRYYEELKKNLNSVNIYICVPRAYGPGIG